MINGIKIDLVTEPLLILNNPLLIDGIRMVGPIEITAMKLQAILDSGERVKDFVDMYFLLELFPFEKMRSFFTTNYPDVNNFMVNNSILYHAEINLEKGVEFTG